jgi:hypothetical protein
MRVNIATYQEVLAEAMVRLRDANINPKYAIEITNSNA